MRDRPGCLNRFRRLLRDQQILLAVHHRRATASVPSVPTSTSDRQRHLADITRATEADEDYKPEAILPLDHDESGLRILVLSDKA